MLEDFESYINNLYNKTNNTEEILVKLKDQLAYVESVLRDLRDQLNNIEDSAFDRAYNTLQDRGRDIFLENAREAVKATEEFDYPIFRERLFSVVKEQNLITIEQIPTGGIVYVNMGLVAGDINDYIEGIEFARKTLNIGKMPPQAASKFWAKNIYGVDREGNRITKKTKEGNKDVTYKYEGKYKKTIEARLSRLSSLAPFWEIIEYGTDVFEGRGGEAYPKFSGIPFVENTRIELQELFDNLYSSTLSEQFESYNKSIKRLTEYRKLIRFEISKVTRSFKRSSEVSTGRGLSEIDIALEVVESYLRDVRGISDQIESSYKLKVAERIISGEITRTYLGDRQSIRLVNLRKVFLQRLDDYIRGE